MKIGDFQGRFACRWWVASLVGGRLGLRPTCEELLLEVALW
jgi:hypothetical protein